jgi:hypothetical protein
MYGDARLIGRGAGRCGLAGSRSELSAQLWPQQEEIMRILRSIQRMLERGLGHDVFEQFRRNRPPAPARLCDFGHPVFSGNKLCSYGHRAT